MFYDKENRPIIFDCHKDDQLGVEIKHQKLFVWTAFDEDDETDIDDLKLGMKSSFNIINRMLKNQDSKRGNKEFIKWQKKVIEIILNYLNQSLKKEAVIYLLLALKLQFLDCVKK